jgi:hypothetical protein
MSRPALQWMHVDAESVRETRPAGQSEQMNELLLAENLPVTQAVQALAACPE